MDASEHVPPSTTPTPTPAPPHPPSKVKGKGKGSEAVEAAPPDTNPDPARCSFWVKHKKRFCRMLVSPNTDVSLRHQDPPAGEISHAPFLWLSCIIIPLQTRAQQHRQRGSATNTPQTRSHTVQFPVEAFTHTECVCRVACHAPMMAATRSSRIYWQHT